MACSNSVLQDAGMNVLELPPPRPASRHASRNPLTAPAAYPGAAPEPGKPIFLEDGSMLLLRPIDPGDVETLMRAFKRMTPEQVRARVFHALSELPEPVARAMCQVDPGQAVALVATDPDGAEIRGEARVHFDTVTLAAELALAIDPQFIGKGLGGILVEHLIRAARAHGMREIWGDTQAGNFAMLALTRRLGFTHDRKRDDASLVRFFLNLDSAAAHELDTSS
jgi:acetyltransferase